VNKCPLNKSAVSVYFEKVILSSERCGLCEVCVLMAIAVDAKIRAYSSASLSAHKGEKPASTCNVNTTAVR
jgi:hypothetical protein